MKYPPIVFQPNKGTSFFFIPPKIQEDHKKEWGTNKVPHHP